MRHLDDQAGGQQGALALDQKVDRALELHDQGDIVSAERACGEVLTVDPCNARALFLRGVLLAELGRNDDCIAAFDGFCALEPNVPEALNLRGSALLRAGRAEQAWRDFVQAIGLNPDFAEAHNNCGAALSAMGEFHAARACYEAALALHPGYIEAMFNRGTAYLALGECRLALESFDEVLAAGADFPELHQNRGISLTKLGCFDQAIASYRRALKLRPTYPEALRSCGATLQMVNRHEEAVIMYSELLAQGGDVLDRVDALSATFYARISCCDWREYDARAREIVELVRQGPRAVHPFTFLYVSGSPEQELKCAQDFVARTAPPQPPLCSGERYTHEKIRVAYISSDFREHAVGYLAAGLFARHDRARFEIYGVSLWPDESAMRARICSGFDHFIEVVGRGDEDVARMLRALEIDIVVHLNGHTEPGRMSIMAFRPGPIQVNFLGYPGTSGAPYFDYIIADAQVIPLGDERYYSEAVVRLPHSYQVNDSERQIAESTPSKTALGLPKQGYVFCGFNKNAKITPETFSAWMRIVSEVHGSVLWLYQSNEAVAANLRREAERRGVDSNRLVFAKHLKLPQHLARQRHADLYLDTLPYNGHTSASDALWAGVPVLTRRGASFTGRVASSLLCAVGLPELIVDTAEAYEALAIRLGRDPTATAALKRKLAQNRIVAPLFDTGLFCRHLEAAFMEMWSRYQKGEAPAGFSLPGRP